MAFRLCNKDRLLKPGRCMVCETKPGHRVVDTGYNLNAATVFDRLRGRKYVCEACGEKIGKALGMVQQPVVNRLKEEIIRLQNREAELQGQIDISAQLDNLTAYLKERSPATGNFAFTDEEAPDVAANVPAEE